MPVNLENYTRMIIQLRYYILGELYRKDYRPEKLYTNETVYWKDCIQKIIKKNNQKDL